MPVNFIHLYNCTRIYSPILKVRNKSMQTHTCHLIKFNEIDFLLKKIF